MITFTLHIEPFAKERPRLARRGCVYTPTNTLRFENSLKFMSTPYRPKKIPCGPILLTVRFFMIPPKRPRHKLPKVRPDLDNLLKAVKDSFNGIFWKDDSQVVRYGVGTGKYYDYQNKKGRIEIQIEEIEE